MYLISTMSTFGSSVICFDIIRPMNETSLWILSGCLSASVGIITFSVLSQTYHFLSLQKGITIGLRCENRATMWYKLLHVKPLGLTCLLW